MNKIKITLALFTGLLLVAVTGCDLLPPLPLLTETRPPVTTTRLPPDLTVAANRILPATVIVDTPFATGTGWVYDSSGIIVTNYHVIQGVRSQNVVVTLNDGRRFNVRSVAADPISDLAIMKVNASGLPAAVIGSSPRSG